MRAVFVFFFITACVFKQPPSGLIVVEKHFAEGDTSHFILAKSWVLDTMSRYYFVDSVGSQSPRSGSQSEPQYGKPLNVQFRMGVANVQIKNLKTGEWYTLLPRDPVFEIKQNTALIEKRQPGVPDSSAYFQVDYRNSFKLINGRMGQKVTCRNILSGRIDSLYVLPDSKSLKKNLFFREKYGLDDIVLESYERWQDGRIYVHQIALLEYMELDPTVFAIPMDYKKVPKEVYFNRLPGQ